MKKPMITPTLDKHLERVAKTAPLRLRVARTAGHFSQAEIARELGITRGRWSQYEKGQRLINWQIANKVSVLCHVDIAYILMGTTPKDARGRIKNAEVVVIAEVKQSPGRQAKAAFRLMVDGQHRWFASPSRRG